MEKNALIIKGGHKCWRKHGAVKDRIESVKMKQAQTPLQHHTLGTTDVALQSRDVTGHPLNNLLILTVAGKKGRPWQSKNEELELKIK